MKVDVFINPFKYIAGFKSLAIGVIVFTVAIYIGVLNKVHFDGVIDIHAGAKAPLWFFFAEAYVSWFIFSLFLYVGSLIISKSKIRIIDIFGTQALAKVPLIFISVICFIPVFHFNYNGIPKIDVWLLTFGLITILFSIWIIALMYNAYSTSANIKGSKAIISFIVVLLISEVLVKVFLIKYLTPFIIKN